MPGAGTGEFYFITAMMILIMVISAVAVYFFFKTYKKEMSEREVRRLQKEATKAEKLKEEEIDQSIEH